MYRSRLEESIAYDTLRGLVENIGWSHKLGGMNRTEKVRFYLRQVLAELSRWGKRHGYDPRFLDREAYALDLSPEILVGLIFAFEKACKAPPRRREAEITAVLKVMSDHYSSRYRPEPPVISDWRELEENIAEKGLCLEYGEAHPPQIRERFL